MGLTAVILAGGEGSRLWPLSRAQCSKPFHTLPGDSESLFEQAVRRALTLTEAEHILILTTEENAEFAADQANAIIPHFPGTIIAEPCARNTAAACMLAALYAHAQDEDALLCILPADHKITPPEALAQHINKALPYAKAGQIASFGVCPSAPSEHYGYLTHAQTSLENDGIYKVTQFCEKPEMELATSLLVQGNCLWNSGIYVLRADVLIDAMQTHAPFIAQRVKAAFETLKPNGFCLHMEREAYAQISALPIDRAIMEQAQNLITMHLNLAWADMGSWRSVWEMQPKDGQGNAAAGEVTLHHSRNCLALSKTKPIIGLGLENTVIVETEGAIFVASRDHAHRLSEALPEMKSKKSAA